MCEHRWRQIYNMAKFRNVVQGANNLSLPNSLFILNAIYSF